VLSMITTGIAGAGASATSPAALTRTDVRRVGARLFSFGKVPEGVSEPEGSGEWRGRRGKGGGMVSPAGYTVIARAASVWLGGKKGLVRSPAALRLGGRGERVSHLVFCPLPGERKTTAVGLIVKCRKVGEARGERKRRKDCIRLGCGSFAGGGTAHRAVVKPQPPFQKEVRRWRRSARPDPPSPDVLREAPPQPPVSFAQ